ncbi:hypothetical protein [Oceanithermus sp.]
MKRLLLPLLFLLAACSRPEGWLWPQLEVRLEGDQLVLERGSSSSLDLLAAPLGTLAEAGGESVRWSLAGVPEGVSYSFSPALARAGERVRLILRASEQAAGGSYELRVEAAGAASEASEELEVIIR